MNDAGGLELTELASALELFRDPIICATIAGAVLGGLSVYVVLRRMVFLSAALTQAAGLGVALAFFVEIHLGYHFEPAVGASLLAIITTFTLLIEEARLRISHEAILGICFVVASSLTIMVGSRITQEAHDIQAILFGTAVLVRPFDLAAVSIAGATIAIVHLWMHRGLLFASFDPVAARVQGLPVARLQAVVLGSVGLMVGVSARALGSMPVLALSTLPGVAALLMGLGLRPAFLFAATVGALSGSLGFFAAYLADTPVGATQSLCAATFVALAGVYRLLRPS